MRILAFSPFPPQEGGGALATYELMKRLTRYEIDLVTYQSPIDHPHNLRVYHIGITKRTSISRGILFLVYGSIIGFLLTLFRKPDVIYAKNLTTPGLCALMISVIFRIPLVLHTSGSEINNLKEVARSYGQYAGLYERFLNFGIRHQILTSTAIIANCMQDKKAIEQRFDHDSQLIYNGVDSHRFAPNKSFRAIKRKELDLADDQHLVLVVGRASQEKGIERHLKLAASLTKISFLFL